MTDTHNVFLLVTCMCEMTNGGGTVDVCSSALGSQKLWNMKNGTIYGMDVVTEKERHAQLC